MLRRGLAQPFSPPGLRRARNEAVGDWAIDRIESYGVETAGARQLQNLIFGRMQNNGLASVALAALDAANIKKFEPQSFFFRCQAAAIPDNALIADGEGTHQLAAFKPDPGKKINDRVAREILNVLELG